MLKTRDQIDNLRVAAPCPMNWEAMTGDARSRFCQQCNLHVYNISELTRREAKALIEETEGRFCARLYKRADGTVMTKDCPVGLSALRRRVSRMAGATITALFSFCVGVMGQKSAQEAKTVSGSKQVESISQNKSQENKGQLQGVVSDPNGAGISGASVALINQSTGKRIETTSNEEGFYRFQSVEVGEYTIQAVAAGFQTQTTKDVSVRLGLVNSANVQLAPPAVQHTVFVGIIAIDDFYPQMDRQGSGHKTVFTNKQITSLPF